VITLRHILTILRVPSLVQYSNLCPHTHTTITRFHILVIMYMPSCACYYKIYTCILIQQLKMPLLHQGATMPTSPTSSEPR
jgi:hypothetical protein